MDLSQKQLEQIISESIEKVLSEGISDITYHFTSLMSSVEILKSDTFNLTMSSNRADAYDSKRLFYLSTQRSRNKELGYAGHLGTCVRFQLNGQKLRMKYKGMPMSYWINGKQNYYDPNNDSIFGKGFSTGKRTHSFFEMEDRIFSYEPTIRNASNYINRIDIYLDTRQDRIANTKVQKYIDDVNRTVAKEKEYIVILYGLANRYKIPVFIYNDLKQFNNMTNNTINDEIAQLYKDDFHATTDKEYNEFDRYRISNDFSRRSKYVTILCELFNVLSLGEIYSMKDKAYKLVATTLKQFGLDAYIADTMKEIKSKWGNSFEESCSLLSNTINAPIRKLNSEHPEEDSNRIMRLGAYILRKYGCSNFDTLRTKWDELRYVKR